MSGRSECTGCGEVFAGDASFDRHRVGRYGDDSRRCLTVAEMEAGEPRDTATGRQTFWTRNHFGFWTHRTEVDVRPRTPVLAVTGSPGAMFGPASPQRPRRRSRMVLRRSVGVAHV